MKKIIFTMVILLMAFHGQAFSQGFMPDAASIEAMIGNHKVVGAALDARMVAEIGVRLYHDTLRSEVDDYKKESDELDKYYRCLDIVDLIVKGTATALHHVSAYNTIKEELKGYKDVLESYEKDILLKGAVWTSDTTVYFTTKRCVLDVRYEAEQLINSYVELVGMITGAAPCKTADLMKGLTDINDRLNNITDVIRSSHYYLLGYMTMRLGYNKREILGAGDLNDIIRNVCDNAYDHWKKSADIAADKNKSKSSGISVDPKIKMGNGGLIGAVYAPRSPYILFGQNIREQQSISIYRVKCQST